MYNSNSCFFNNDIVSGKDHEISSNMKATSESLSQHSRNTNTKDNMKNLEKCGTVTQSNEENSQNEITPIDKFIKTDINQGKISKQMINDTQLRSTNIETIDLAQRRDVINKTVLRILRRFYIQKFKEMFPEKFKTKQAKNKWFFEYVKKFTIQLFGADHEDLKILQAYLASIINTKHMTKNDIIETQLENQEFLTFYNTLYKYSHTRVINLFRVKPIGILYVYFFRAPKTEMLKSEVSVHNNSQLYEVAFSDFWKVFRGELDGYKLTVS